MACIKTLKKIYKHKRIYTIYESKDNLNQLERLYNEEDHHKVTTSDNILFCKTI